MPKFRRGSSWRSSYLTNEELREIANELQVDHPHRPFFAVLASTGRVKLDFENETLFFDDASQNERYRCSRAEFEKIVAGFLPNNVNLILFLLRSGIDVIVLNHHKSKDDFDLFMENISTLAKLK